MAIEVEAVSRSDRRRAIRLLDGLLGVVGVRLGLWGTRGHAINGRVS